jgi:hypothetical protein
MAFTGVINALIRLTGLSSIIRQDMASQAFASGLLNHMSDSIGSEMSILEQSLSEFSMLTRVSRERSVRYRDYDAMDDYGDVSVALDIYAEEATQSDLIKQQNLWITGSPKEVKEISSLFKRLKMRDMLYGIARTIAKYGDLFTRLNINESGIDGLLFIPPKLVNRKGPDINRVKMYTINQEMKHITPRKDGMFFPWELVHFRIMSFGFSHLYGHSLVEPARKRWLHLKLLEDSVSIYRLNRAVERIVYYIDVGTLSPTEALHTVQKYKSTFSNKRKWLNPNSTEFELQYDPSSMLEDIYWPVSASNDRSRIDKLQAPPEQGQLQDLEHFSNKLYVALGVPKDYITGDISGAWNSRESLSLQDIRFSRKIQRLQLAVLDGLERIARIHLAVISGDPDYAASANFKIHLADISIVARQQYETVLLQRTQLIAEFANLQQILQLNRENWLRLILPRYFPDISEEEWGTLIIPDSVLAKAEQDNFDNEIKAKESEIKLKAKLAKKPAPSSKKESASHIGTITEDASGHSLPISKTELKIMLKKMGKI